MAAATLTKKHEGVIPGLGLNCMTFHTVLAANGEDGVTIKLDWTDVTQVLMTAASVGLPGPFEWAYSGGTLTLTAPAGADGDSAPVSVMVLGHD